MKRLIVLIAVIVITSASNLGFVQTAVSSNSIGLQADNVTLSAVLIVHSWRQMYAGKLYDVSAKSLGTVISPDLILTHHHFDQPLGRLPEEMFVFDDAVGRTIQWRPGNLKLTTINAGTTEIRLPAVNFATTARVADGATLKHLAVGVWLTVCYWDNQSDSLGQHDFQVMQIKEGIIKLADPDRLINPGDSGGGVFLEDQLIGNTWSIDMDQADNMLGQFNVALLSPEVISFVRQP